MTMLRISLLGDKKTIRALDRLSDRARRKVVRQAATAMARPIVREAKSRVPRETGLLRRAIAFKSKSFPRRGLVFVTIGIRSDVQGLGPSGRLRRPIKYAHLVEFGTATTAERPFMGPALHTKRAQAIAKGAAILVKGIEREAAKK